MSIRVLLSDDHRIVREGIRALLDKEPDIEVIGEAEDGHSTVELARKLKPQVVIMDITMRGLNGMAATRQITQEMPDVKVLALSMHTHSWFIGKMKEAGAKGYLLKDCASEELARAIRTVFANQTYLSPRLAEHTKDCGLRGGRPGKSGLGNAGSTTLEARDESR
jgi:DNA-binding NarL/FixJ family response regulator